MDDVRKNKTVTEILKHLGCTAVRRSGSEQWIPLSEICGEYGTTDEVAILDEHKNYDHVLLVDRDTEELLAEARREPGEEQGPEATKKEEGGQSEEETEEDLSQLRGKATCPNARTVAYLAHLALRRTLSEAPEHTQLVTTANLASLKACDEGLALTDLDQVRFDTLETDRPTVVVQGPSGSVSVELKSRPHTLEEPWDGTYAFAKVFATTAGSES